MEDINELLNNAKLSTLVKGSKFISSVVFSLKHIITDEVPTAATNGIVVKYNPSFLYNLSKEERVFLVLHETWHVVLCHLLRREHRDPKLWNYAGDYVINALLIDAGFKMPKGGLYKKEYEGLSTNEVYELIKEDPPDTPDFSPEDLEEAESTEAINARSHQIKQILVKAQTRSKLANEQGVIPNEVARLIDELTNPKLPWYELLNRFMNERVKEDYTWTRPNRRFAPDYILPSQFSESLGHIAIAIDTSGSVTQEELTELLSEIRYIYETMKPSKLTVMDCDYVIHNIYEITEGEDITQLHFSGGGGTRFEPVFDYLKDKEIQALIYFTDLYAKPIEEEPNFPVLWICNSNHPVAEIGETIYLN